MTGMIGMTGMTDMKCKRVVRRILTAVLCLVILFCAVRLYIISDGYRQAERIKESMMLYKPTLQTDQSGQTDQTGQTESTAEPTDDAATPTILPDTSPDQSQQAENRHILNEGLETLRGRNEDVVGWITVPDTAIDYPVVQAADNDYYLHRDINRDYLYAGSIFIDNRCEADPLGFNTIIYGHKMLNGSMFADIHACRERWFFDAHPTGYYHTVYASYRIEFFAFLNVSTSSAVYQLPHTQEQQATHLEYVLSAAKFTRDIEVSETDLLVSLSTCSYEFTGARAILVGKLVQIA